MKALAGLLCLLPLAAAAQPTCAPPAIAVAIAVAPGRQVLLASADGLGVASHRGGLELRSLARGAKLSAEAGILVELRDGSECVLEVTGGDSMAIRLTIAPAAVAAVEAGVCDSRDGVCIPTRVELHRR